MNLMIYLCNKYLENLPKHGVHQILEAWGYDPTLSCWISCHGYIGLWHMPRPHLQYLHNHIYIDYGVYASMRQKNKACKAANCVTSFEKDSYGWILSSITKTTLIDILPYQFEMFYQFFCRQIKLVLNTLRGLIFLMGKYIIPRSHYLTCVRIVFELQWIRLLRY